jgi:hypothetical protein
VPRWMRGVQSGRKRDTESGRWLRERTRQEDPWLLGAELISPRSLWVDGASKRWMFGIETPRSRGFSPEQRPQRMLCQVEAGPESGG